MEFLPVSLQALSAYRQFIVYTLVPRGAKTDKLPIDHRSGQVANAHDPNIWLGVDEAIALAKTNGYGVGFVITSQDPFWFLDIDDCLIDGKWSDLASTLLKYLQGAAVEVSTSGRGLHLIGSGKPPVHGCRNSDHKLEFYTSARFIALTGTHASGDAAFDPGEALIWLIDQYFSGTNTPSQTVAWSHEPVPQWNGPTDDVELISRALRSSSASGVFSGKARFSRLVGSEH